VSLCSSFPLSKHTGECETALAFSGLHVYLQFMWEVGLPPLLCSFPPTATFTSFPAPDYWVVLLLLPASMFVYSSRGKWVFPPSCGVFLPLPLSQAFQLLVAGCAPCSRQNLFCLPGLFIYSSGKDSLPPILGAQCTPPSLPCVFIVLIAYYSVSLFSRGGGRSVQGAMLLWPRVVCGSTAVPQSSTCPRLPKLSGRGRLVSPFNMKWRCSAPAGGVEGSKFCLFLVILPAVCLQCLSKISL
jgi:hypothetical protein